MTTETMIEILQEVLEEGSEKLKPNTLGRLALVKNRLKQKLEKSDTKNTIHNIDYTKCSKCGSDRVEQNYYCRDCDNEVHIEHFA